MIGGLQGDFGNLDIKYLKQNIPEDLKMSVANIRMLQENTAAVQHSAFQLGVIRVNAMEDPDMADRGS